MSVMVIQLFIVLYYIIEAVGAVAQVHQPTSPILLRRKLVIRLVMLL